MKSIVIQTNSPHNEIQLPSILVNQNISASDTAMLLSRIHLGNSNKVVTCALKNKKNNKTASLLLKNLIIRL